MLARAIPNIIPVRKKKNSKHPKPTLFAQSPETGRSLVVLLGKRGARGKKTLFIEKKGFLPS
jgi:hypothetical protein